MRKEAHYVDSSDSKTEVAKESSQAKKEIREEGGDIDVCGTARSVFDDDHEFKPFGFIFGRIDECDSPALIIDESNDNDSGDDCSEWNGKENDEHLDEKKVDENATTPLKEAGANCTVQEFELVQMVLDAHKALEQEGNLPVMQAFAASATKICFILGEILHGYEAGGNILLGSFLAVYLNSPKVELGNLLLCVDEIQRLVTEVKKRVDQSRRINTEEVSEKKTVQMEAEKPKKRKAGSLFHSSKDDAKTFCKKLRIGYKGVKDKVGFSSERFEEVKLRREKVLEEAQVSGGFRDKAEDCGEGDDLGSALGGKDGRDNPAIADAKDDSEEVHMFDYTEDGNHQCNYRQSNVIFAEDLMTFDDD